MIAGIESVTSGEIQFNGQAVNNISPQKRNTSMAFESYNLYPHFNVYENIAFPCVPGGWGLKLTRQEERQNVREIADFLGIGELLGRLPQHLSGGQKQRVSLARALVRKPEVYLLDEPIAHLDARLKFSTQTLVKEFSTKYRSTIIYVTHDYREALALSDRIVVLHNGVIEQEGTPEEVFNTPATDFVGRLLGEPPMNLIDGVIISRNGKKFFEVEDKISIRIRDDLVDSIQKATDDRGEGQTAIRLGIRCENIKVSRRKITDNSFQLPVYAIVHEAETSVVTFELEHVFIHVRTGEEKGLCDYSLSETVWLDFDQSQMFFYKKSVDLSKA